LPPTTDGLETECDYSGRNGRDRQKTGKVDEKRKREKRKKEKEHKM